MLIYKGFRGLRAFRHNVEGGGGRGVSPETGSKYIVVDPPKPLRYIIFENIIFRKNTQHG